MDVLTAAARDLTDGRVVLAALALLVSVGQKPGTGRVVLAAAVLVGLYVTACVVWPLTACGRCDGTGKRRRGVQSG